MFWLEKLLELQTSSDTVSLPSHFLPIREGIDGIVR